MLASQEARGSATMLAGVKLGVAARSGARSGGAEASFPVVSARRPAV
jgi:hypothetical protein